MIYRNIDLLDPYFFGDLLHRTVTDPQTSKPADFFAQHVKVLVISTRYRQPEVVQILRACSGARMVANWMGLGESDAMRELFSSSHFSPSRYSVSAVATELSSWPLEPGAHRMDFSLPIFQNLTHLEILCATGEGCRYWNSLSSLSNLTHLSVYHFYFFSPNFVEVTKKILRQCPKSLRILVNWMPSLAYGRGNWDKVHAINEGVVDPRAIIAYCNRIEPQTGHFEFALRRSFADRTRDWMGKTVGKDFWELAEEIVERRREWLHKFRGTSHQRCQFIFPSALTDLSLKFADVI